MKKKLLQDSFSTIPTPPPAPIISVGHHSTELFPIAYNFTAENMEEIVEDDQTFDILTLHNCNPDDFSKILNCAVNFTAHIITKANEKAVAVIFEIPYEIQFDFVMVAIKELAQRFSETQKILFSLNDLEVCHIFWKTRSNDEFSKTRIFKSDLDDDLFNYIVNFLIETIRDDGTGKLFFCHHFIA